MQQLPDPINTQNRHYSQYPQWPRQPQSIQRTQPALPGVTLPTAPVVAPQTPIPPFYTNKKPRRRLSVGRTLLLFFLAGVLIEVAYLGLYPLFAHARSSSDAQQNALLALLPWIPKLYWSNAFPFISPLLSAVPLLNPANPVGNTNLQLLLLFLASLGVLLAFVAGRRLAKARLTATDGRVLLWTILLFTALFGTTLLLAPVSLNVFSQDSLLYGLYGRLVVFYHVNPYVIAPLHSPAAVMHDSLLTILGIQATSSPMLAGPIWTDLSLLVTLLAGNSVANTIIDFRLMGLIAHIVNVALLWAILTKIKPETASLRITATLFYAWNPLVLFYSVPFMHLDVVVVTLLLLAVLFYQRSSPLLGWVFALLAALINPLCLLLLPIFFRFMLRESRLLRIGGRTLWWMGMLCLSPLIFALAYAPY